MQVEQEMDYVDYQDENFNVLDLLIKAESEKQKVMEVDLKEETEKYQEFQQDLKDETEKYNFWDLNLKQDSEKYQVPDEDIREETSTNSDDAELTHQSNLVITKLLETPQRQNQITFPSEEDRLTTRYTRQQNLISFDLDADDQMKKPVEMNEEQRIANFNAFMEFAHELEDSNINMDAIQQDMKTSSQCSNNLKRSTSMLSMKNDYYRESSSSSNFRSSTLISFTNRVGYALVNSGIGRLVRKKIPEHLFLGKHYQRESNIIFRSQFINKKEDNLPRILQNLAYQKSKAADWTIKNSQLQSTMSIDLAEVKMFQLQLYGESPITNLQEISRRMLVEYAFTNDLPILKISRNSWLTFQYCVQKQLIPSKYDCKFCGNPMRIVKSYRENDGCYWRCYKYSRNCSSTLAVRSGTIFCHSRITIMEQLKVMLHYFVRNFNAREASNEIEEMTGIDSYKSIEQIYKMIRQQIHIWTQNHYRKYKLGAFGRIVEIDESLFNTVGKDGNQVWVLGFYERGTKDQRAIYIKDRSIETITQVILENVTLGAEIYTDYYRGYSGLKQYYKHNVINREFGKSQNTAEFQCTNRVESMWSQIKRRFRLYGCRNRLYLQYYLDETLWKIKTKVFQDRIDFLLQLNHYHNFSSDLFQTNNEPKNNQHNSMAANVGAYVVTTEPGLFREQDEYFNYEDSQFNTQTIQDLKAVQRQYDESIRLQQNFGRIKNALLEHQIQRQGDEGDEKVEKSRGNYGNEGTEEFGEKMRELQKMVNNVDQGSEYPKTDGFGDQMSEFPKLSDYEMSDFNPKIDAFTDKMSELPMMDDLEDEEQRSRIPKDIEYSEQNSELPKEGFFGDQLSDFPKDSQFCDQMSEFSKGGYCGDQMSEVHRDIECGEQMSELGKDAYRNEQESEVVGDVDVAMYDSGRDE